jgi:gas vesicle protein
MKIDKKNLQWIVITIFLGAVGSGFWEYILRSIALSGTNIFLEIASLGVVSFKNSLYVEIAQGHHEEPSLALLKFSLSALPAAILGILLTFPRQSTIKQPKKHTETEQLKERLEQLIERMEIETEQSKEQLGQSKEQLEQLRERMDQLKERIEIETEQLNQIEKIDRESWYKAGYFFCS